MCCTRNFLRVPIELSNYQFHYYGFFIRLHLLWQANCLFSGIRLSNETHFIKASWSCSHVNSNQINEIRLCLDNCSANLATLQNIFDLVWFAFNLNNPYDAIEYRAYDISKVYMPIELEISLYSTLMKILTLSLFILSY